MPGSEDEGQGILLCDRYPPNTHLRLEQAREGHFRLSCSQSSPHRYEEHRRRFKIDPAHTRQRTSRIFLPLVAVGHDTQTRVVDIRAPPTVRLEQAHGYCRSLRFDPPPLTLFDEPPPSLPHDHEADRLTGGTNPLLVKLDSDLQTPLIVVSSLTVFQGLTLLVATILLDRLGSESRMS